MEEDVHPRLGDLGPWATEGAVPLWDGLIVLEHGPVFVRGDDGVQALVKQGPVDDSVLAECCRGTPEFSRQGSWGKSS